MLLSRTLRLFLDGIGRREEYEYYLNVFHDAGEGCFAALMPDLPSLEQSCDLMIFDLRFLLRLDLIPLVLLCGPDARAMERLLAQHGEVVLRREASPENLAQEAASCVKDARAGGRIPVLVATGSTAADAARCLVPGVFRRLHVLRAQGGLRTAEAQLVWYHWLQGQNRQRPAEEESSMLDTARSCLEHCPSMHFSVASPLNLLEELFTVKGAGTVIRPGSDILRVTDIDEVDMKALLGLLRNAFGRSLAQPDILQNVDAFYIEQRYRGAALLESHPAGCYLSKFAVGLQARGEGLALELWNRVEEEHPALFWRSQVGNSINAWYERYAEGRHRAGEWQVYWRGIEPVAIPQVIDYAVTRLSDFVPEGITE